MKVNYKESIFILYSKQYSNKGFVKIDDGSQQGTHWTAFYLKNNKTYYVDSFEGAPE